MKTVICIMQALSLAGLLTVSGQSPAGTGQPETVLPAELNLGKCFQLTLEHNLSIRDAAEAIRLQEGIYMEARSGRLPRVDLNGGYTIIDEGRMESFGGLFSPETESWQADLTVSYLVYSGGQVTALSEAQKYRIEAAREQFRAVVNGVLLGVSQDYFLALVATERIAVQKEAIALYEEQLTLAKNRFEAGSGPKFDVLRAEVTLANARPPLIRAQNDFRLAIDSLRRQIGVPYGPGMTPEMVKLAPNWPNDKIDLSLDQSLREALEKRPELAVLARQVEAGTKDVDAARSGRRPQVQVAAGYGAQSGQFGGGSLDGWVAQLQVNWPVWDGQATQGRVRQSQSRLLSTELAERSQRLAIEGEVRQAYFQYEEGTEILATSKLVIEQAEEALRLAESRYAAGASTQLDVLQSQLDLTQAKLENAQALFNYNLAVFSLRRAIGSLGGQVAAPPTE